MWRDKAKELMEKRKYYLQPSPPIPVGLVSQTPTPGPRPPNPTEIRSSAPKGLGAPGPHPALHAQGSKPVQFKHPIITKTPNQQQLSSPSPHSGMSPHLLPFMPVAFYYPCYTDICSCLLEHSAFGHFYYKMCIPMRMA